MADMIKFFKGLEASLPASGVNGALYITTDEGAIYLGTGTGMKRLGDFVQVDNVASLPEKAHESCLYYCVAENILAKWNGTEWKQINKQPTADEMKTLLGLGSLAYKSEVAEGDLNADLKAKVNAAAEGNHAHANKAELDKIAEGDVAKWNAAEQNAKDYADGLDEAMDTRVKAVEAAIGENGSVAGQIKTAIEALDFTDTAVDGEYVSAVNEVDGKISVTRKALPDYTETYDAKGAANTAFENAKAYADGLAANYDEKGAAAGVKTELETEIAKKVDKVDGKSLVDNAEITKLAGVSEGANKVEKSDTNGNIKVDGQEVVVYTHPDKHTIADVTGLQDALDGKQAAGDYSVEGHKHAKADITDFAHTHVAADVTDLDATIKGYDYATKTEAQGYANAKDEAIAAAQKTADDITTYVGTFTASEGVDTVVKYIDAKTANIASDETVGALADRVEQAEKDIEALETESAKHAIKTEVEGALALKADKSVVDAMYTNDQIDGFIAEAKKYADDNDADTKYGIVYDSENKKIKLVEGGTDVEIDASAFIKDGMISNVTIGDDNDLVITFNTDAGKENIVLPLDQLVDIYTGVEGDRVKITVNADKSISADLITGSIGKDYLDEGVKASLALADSALQSHQDISHLATKDELKGVDDKFANYTTTTDLNTALDLKADKTQVATDIATAKGEAISAAETKAGELDAALKTELQKEIDDDVKALADTVYTKTEVEALLTWGEF